jgi:hypothetical protein
MRIRDDVRHWLALDPPPSLPPVIRVYLSSLTFPLTVILSVALTPASGLGMPSVDVVVAAAAVTHGRARADE